MKQKIMTCLGFNDRAQEAVMAIYLSDPARSDRVTRTVMQMAKLDIAALQRAYEGA